MPGELALDESVVEVEEGERLRAAVGGVGEHRRAATAPVIGRPPSPATTVCTVDRSAPVGGHGHVGREHAAEADAERLLDHHDPAGAGRAPRAPRRAGRAGRSVMPTHADPLAVARAASSTASLIVPSTDPSATTTVSASSVRYGGPGRPLSRPKAAANSAASSGIALERVELAEVGQVADLRRRPRARPWPRSRPGRPGRAPGGARRAGRKRVDLRPGRAGRPARRRG